MRQSDKTIDPDQYDRLVSAELPDQIRYPRLHNMVVAHMMHGPCGSLRKHSPCMIADTNSCRFHYPKQFNPTTLQGDDSFPQYRRRNNGRKVLVRTKWLDNIWVVPHNPKLLMMLNCHINVEICSSIKSVKYVFKYVYKGHDTAAVQVEPDGAEEINATRFETFKMRVGCLLLR